MGVDLSGLVTAERRAIADLAGKSVAIDAYNTIYQFLSSVRMPDGTPLRDGQGRVVSHLSGILQRTTNLLSAGVRTVYVFDGVPHPLKMDTIVERRERKQRAEEEYREALAAGDIDRARSKAMQTSKVTDEIILDSRRLLDALGVPYVSAPSEGEAQASHMALRGDVWAAGSQDFDTLLFGAPRLVRNMTISGRRKLPRQKRYVDVLPEVIRLDRVLEDLGIDRAQLVDLAILVGTDFNRGIRGIGPKKALKYMREHGDLESVIAVRGLEIPDYEEVRRIFLEPDVTDDYRLEWRMPDVDAVIELLVEEHDFSRSRVESSLRKVESFHEAASQRSLEDFF
ncbi:MAG TPA: flap endonuclease-1 [Thermoplasmata archaeon]|nr:flap endonuclease-1 [Thermoplasmata archaeon]